MVGRVVMRGPNRRVADVINTWLKIYSVTRGERHLSEAKIAFDALSVQVDIASKELAAVSARRVGFLDSHALVFDLQKESQDVKTLAEIENSMITTRQKIAGLEATLSSVESSLTQQTPTTKLQTITELNALRENAAQRRQELQASLIMTLNHYRQDSPEVAELRDSIVQFDKLIAASPDRVERGSTEGLNSVHQQLLLNRNSLQAELGGARASLVSLEASAVKLRASLVKVPAIQDELRLLDRYYGSAAEKFQALLSKRAQVEVSMATATATTPSLRVVDYAVTPSSRYWPRAKILYPAALAVGLLLGLLAAQIKRLAGGRVRRDSWGRRQGDAPLYGSVALPSTSPVTLVRMGSGGDASSDATGR
jgi:uncharacterized protein involved in exopolysaccharide biosynthesis